MEIMDQANAQAGAYGSVFTSANMRQCPVQVTLVYTVVENVISTLEIYMCWPGSGPCSCRHVRASDAPYVTLGYHPMYVELDVTFPDFSTQRCVYPTQFCLAILTRSRSLR